MGKADTRGLTEDYMGKALRLQRSGGEVEEMIALELTVCDPPEACCGLTYRLLHTSKPGAAKVPGSVYWVAFDQIANFKTVGENTA